MGVNGDSSMETYIPFIRWNQTCLGEVKSPTEVMTVAERPGLEHRSPGLQSPCPAFTLLLLASCPHPCQTLLWPPGWGQRHISSCWTSPFPVLAAGGQGLSFCRTLHSPGPGRSQTSCASVEKTLSKPQCTQLETRM